MPMLRMLDHLEEGVVTLLMGCATVIIFVAVVHRYAMGIPGFYPYLSGFSTSWAQEVCIYLFIWMAKFGAAYGVRTGIHMGVDVLVRRLPEEIRKRVTFFGLLCGVAFTAIIGTLGAHFVWAMSQTDQTSADLELPMWVVYLCIPLGSYLMCFRFVQVAWHFFHTGEMPHYNQLQVAGLDEKMELSRS
ncbi:MAG: TRAP transporter small permease [Magnetococcales bacterium]|nr:TRAP transporter small permease [Magnetococcales bacterium]MBF0437797.1 TRAP transporter small permease [Magnetococcales bacterium]